MSYSMPRAIQRFDNFDINSTGVKKVWAIIRPTLVHSVGLFFVNGSSDAGGATVKIQKVVNNSATDLIVFTIPAASQANKLLYNELSTPVELQAGEALQINVTAEGVAALTVDVSLEYSLLDSRVADSRSVAQTSNVTA